jgi:hypothetical protein
MRLRAACLILSLATLFLLPAPARAVILANSPNRNTSPPTGTLANSGWQWEGQWGDYLGTAISKHYFITAEHVGGTVGESFILNGVSYHTIATYDDPQSDLQVWRIDGTFPTWAPLYKRDKEADRGVVIYGRGTQRGDEINVNGQLKGWLWSTDDRVESWGTNIIVGTNAGKSDSGAAVANSRIYWKFDRAGQPQEGTVSTGDSSGGVFLKELGYWKLAGVNLAVESEFKMPDSDETQMGALLDIGGLKVGDNDTIITDTVKDIPTRGYATRISNRVPWIFDVVEGKVPPSATATPGSGVPEPSAAIVAAICAGLMCLRRSLR